MNYVLKYENEPIVYILLESLISMLLMQLFKYVLNKIYIYKNSIQQSPIF